MLNKLLYVSNFEGNSIGAYLFVETFLNQLTVSIALEGKQLQFEVVHREFYQSTILCIDALLNKFHVHNSLVNVLVGLDDGIIQQLLINTAHLASPCLQTCVVKFSSSVTFLRIFQSFVICGAKEGDLSIFYEKDNNFVRVNVVLESCLLSEEIGSYVTTPSVPSCCEIFDTDGSYFTHTNITDFNQRYWLFLNQYCDNIAANATLQPGDCSAAFVSEQSVLLLGCTDGSIWCVTTPERSTVLSMTSCLEGEAGCQLSVRGALLVDTFDGPVEQLILSPLSLEEVLGTVHVGNDVCVVEEGNSVGCSKQCPCATLWVLAADGHGAVLGLERATCQTAAGYASSALLRPRQLDFELFPSTGPKVGVNTLRFIDGLFLYTDPQTGALWSSHLVKPVNGSSSHAEVVQSCLSSSQCPIVHSCQIVVLAAAGATDTTSSLGHLVLTTDVGVNLLLYEVPCSSQSLSMSQRVMLGLQCVLSGGWCIQPMVPICLTNKPANSSMAGVSRVSFSNRTVTTSGELLGRLRILGEKLLQVQRKSIEAVERELQLDCSLLRVMALLAELGDMRDGLRLLPGHEDSTSLWEWSIPHCNKSQAVSLQFKLRRESSGSGDSINWMQSSSLFLDLRLQAQSLCAMRALQDRPMLVSLESVVINGGKSPQCSATAFAASIAWQRETIDDFDSIEQKFLFLCTVPLTSIDRLSDYNLRISLVAGDGTGGGSTTSVIFLIEQLLPLYAMVPIVVCSDDYSNSIRFRNLQRNLVSGSEATMRSLDLMLPEPRFPQGMLVSLRWQRMIQKIHDAVLRKETQQHLFRSNPLHAAFLNSDKLLNAHRVMSTTDDPVILNISPACEPDMESSCKMKAKHSSADAAHLSLESNTCSILIHIAAELSGLGLMDDDNVAGTRPANCRQEMAILAHIARQDRGTVDHANSLKEIWRCYQLLRETCCA